jgi:hypothetical protein
MAPGRSPPRLNKLKVKFGSFRRSSRLSAGHAQVGPNQRSSATESRASSEQARPSDQRSSEQQQMRRGNFRASRLSLKSTKVAASHARRRSDLGDPNRPVLVVSQSGETEIERIQRDFVKTVEASDAAAPCAWPPSGRPVSLAVPRHATRCGFR